MLNLVSAKSIIDICRNCPLEVCEQRDIKGGCTNARAGEIREFTGISSLYEQPAHPNLMLDTGWLTLESCAQEIVALMLNRGILAK